MARDARIWVAAVAVAGSVVAGCAAAQDRQTLVAEGQRAFAGHGCYGCHTMGAAGTPIATDLSRVGARRSEEELRAWVLDPRSQRPTAHMPRLGLSEREARALAAWLARLR